MALVRAIRGRVTATAVIFCFTLAVAQTANAATYYGPPYKVQSFRGVGSFESVGAAVNFLVQKIKAPCQQDPKCTKPPVVTVRYGTDGWAATIFVNGKSSDNVFASEISIGQPQKNLGGCQKRCSAGLGSATDGTGARGSADSSAYANARDPGSPFEGDPINTSTGNFYRQETDYESPSGLMFRRFYNSSVRAPGSSLGPQWRHLFDRRLEILASNTGAAGERTFIRATRPDGASELFTRTESAWTVDSDVADVLVDREAGAGYALQLAANGQTEIYDSAGLLQEVYDASGQRTLVLGYSGAVTPTEAAPGPDMLLSVADSSGRSLRFSYNSASQLTKVLLPDGGVQAFTYNASGQLASVTYPDFTVKGYIYNEPANSPAAAGTSFLTGIIDEKGARYETIKYNYNNRAYHAEFAGGVDTTTLDYAASTWKGTLPVTVKGPLGAASRLGFVDTGKGRLMPAGGSAACGNQCNQPYKAMTYDANGYPASVTDFKGSITRTVYGPNGLLAEQVEAAGTSQQRTTTTTWDATLRAPLSRVVMDAEGATVSSTSWKYNAVGLEVARCEVDPTIPAAAGYACGSMINAPEGTRQWATSYCTSVDFSRCPQLGLVLTEDGPRTDVQDVTVYSYYQSTDESGCGTVGGACHRVGDLYQATNALGQKTTWLTYDRNGRATRLRDGSGKIHDLSYTPRGKLTSLTERAAQDGSTSPQDSVTTITFDSAENVTSIVDPDGAALNYNYDDAHRLIRINDGEGNSIHYVLDAAGNRIKEDVVDSGGTMKRSLSRAYNPLGQLLSQKTAGGDATDIGYDVVGNAQLITDALKRKMQATYDPRNRVSQTVQDIGGVAAKTTYDYDPLDRIIKVTDPKGLATTYQYNGLGDMVKQVSPDGGTSSSAYNGAGDRIVSIDARGIRTDYTYDALGRLTRSAYSDAALDSFYTYDVIQTVCAEAESFATGRLSKVEDASGSTQFCYDHNGRVVRKVQTNNGKALIVRYTYSKAGRLKSVTYPDGAVVDYVRDALGQVTEVGVTPAGSLRQTLLRTSGYYPFGPSAGWTYGNGRTLMRTLDFDYRPLAVGDGRSDGLNVGFAFDEVGNLVALTAPGGMVPAISLVYDTLGRMTAFNDGATGAVIDGYSYDATGNRLNALVNGQSQTYDYAVDSHRLSSVGGVPRRYDASGNTTAINGTERTFSYDATGRMSQVWREGVLAMKYSHNWRGEQVYRSINTSGTYSLYDESGHWMGDYDENGQSIQQVIWLEDLPVGVLASSTLNYIQPDHLGTPRAVISADRDTAIWTWDIRGEAFGGTAPNEDPDRDGKSFTFNLRFPGQRYDKATGLNQNYLRDYDASVGRYVQSDPIGLAGGNATYGYVDGAPLAFVDPFGLKKVVLVGAQNKDDAIIYKGALADVEMVGYCVVYAHGAWTHISDTRAGTANKVRYFGNDDASMSKFNDLLSRSGCKPEEPVILKACNTGANPEVKGMTNVMTGLSRARRTEVDAPTRSVWYTPRGPMATPYGHKGDIHGPMNLSDPGEYRSVRP